MVTEFGRLTCSVRKHNHYDNHEAVDLRILNSNHGVAGRVCYGISAKRLSSDFRAIFKMERFSCDFGKRLISAYFSDFQNSFSDFQHMRFSKRFSETKQRFSKISQRFSKRLFLHYPAIFVLRFSTYAIFVSDFQNACDFHLLKLPN